MDPAARLRQAYRALLVTGVVAAGALAAAAWLYLRGGAPAAADPNARFDDPEVRKAAIAELVARGSGGWDSFPDPEVGRLLQPNLANQRIEGYHVSTNAFGLREAAYVLPKPTGTTRVVLLGDSFVMGHGVEAGERFGAKLAEALRARAPGAGPIECLHVGLNTWNIVAETAFLRRQLSLLQPDLVVHVIVRNDLEDNVGARGFGAMSNFNPAHPERGDGIFQTRVPSVAFGLRENNWIAHGLDEESRARFEDAGRRIADLARRVEAAGGRYVLLDYYTGLLPASRKFIAAQLRPEQVGYLPTALIQDKRYRIAADNAHWNPAGHELVARIAYSLVRSRKLLPGLALAEWSEADAAAAEWLGKGEAEAAEEPKFDVLPGRRRIRPALDFAALDEESAAQVTGGIQKGGLVGPYAAVVLQGGGARLKVAGRCLPRPELDGARVDVLVEAEKVGQFVVAAGQPVALDLPVPAAIAARPFVSVRFAADDWAYAGDDLRQHVVFALERVALE